MHMSRRCRIRVFLWLGMIAFAGGGISRAEVVPVRADDGTVICSISLPPGWVLVATPKMPGSSGAGRWAPRDATSLWGVPIGENGGGNSIVDRARGVSAAAVTLGAASSAAEAFHFLQARLPGFSATEFSLSGAVRQVLDRRGLQYAAYESAGEPTVLVLGRPGELWVALLLLTTAGGPARTELEEFLVRP
jgi:hypothetical protein